MREHDVEKLEKQPLVHDGDYIDPSTDTDGAVGAVVVIVGTPGVGDAPIFDGTKFVPTTPGATPSTGLLDYTSALQFDADARIRAGSGTTIDEQQIAYAAQFFGA